jgi:phage N-6-adenine-methyltransferase
MPPVQTWQTPRWFFEPLLAEFRFVLDAAASKDNALCPVYIDEAADALAVPDWRQWLAEHTHIRVGGNRASDFDGCAAWLNPPYRNLGEWVEKAEQQCRKGLVVVVLALARTDSQWWHDYAMRADECRLIRGRISFVDPATGKPRGSTPMGQSVLLVFRPHWTGPPRFVCVDRYDPCRPIRPWEGNRFLF